MKQLKIKFRLLFCIERRCIAIEQIELFFKDIFYENGLGYISMLKNWNIALSKEKFNELEENINGTAFFDMPFKFNKFLNHAKECIQNAEEDVYFSINNFMRKRETESVWRLNCFAIDFDFYKIEKYKNLTPEEFYQDVLKYNLLIKPNYVINSGKGLYMIFNIYDPPPKQCTNIYRAIYKKLVSDLIDYGADAKASLVTQVIRIPGTINSKNGAEVKIIETNQEKYTFRKFIDLLPYTKEESRLYKEAKQSYKNSLRRKTIESKRFRENTKKILEDFETLIELRNQNNVYDGYRELLIYLARERCRFSNYTLAEELRIATKLNEQFKSPLTDAEVFKNANPSDLPNPTSKDTIIAKLELTEEEMMQMRYLRCHKTDVKLKKQFERNKMKQILLLKGTEKTLKRLKDIFKAIQDNLKISKQELAERFNVSERQLYRDLKYIKEHKALFVENKIELESEVKEVVLQLIEQVKNVARIRAEYDP